MQRNPVLAGLIFLIFFVISLLTNILGPIIPDIINSFQLSLTAAALICLGVGLFGPLVVNETIWSKKQKSKSEL